MLHGEIKVNHHEIAKWRAVRKESLIVAGEDGWNEYECRLEYTNLAGKPMEAAFTVAHRFGDGAVVLAAKVLTQGWPNLKPKPRGMDGYR